MSDDVVSTGECPREDDVDPTLADDLLPLRALRLAGHEADRAHAIATDVHQRAAVELGPEAGVVLAVHGGELEAHGDPHDAKASNRAFGHELRDLRGLRVMPPHEPLREDEARGLGDIERALDFLRVPGERLLAQHVFPGLERAQRPLDVHRVRQWDVDRLDVGIGKQRVVACVRALDLVVAGVGLRAGGVSARHGDHVGPIGLPSAFEHEAVDPGRRQEGPAEAHSGGASFVNACSSSLFVAPVMIATASGIVCVCGVTTATRLPSRMIRIRSASSKTCGMSWLMMITGRPRSRTRWIRSSTWRVSLTPRAAVGSSMIASRCAHLAALATATP